MELEFKRSSMPYLRRVLQEIRNLEETGETIVPDSYPDILSIIHTYAEAIIRGKDCRKGSVSISGGIKGGLIYLPEDQSGPKKLDFYLPFTVKVENPSLTEQAKTICSVKVRSVDGHIINSRKAVLRVNLGCRVTAFEPAEEEIFELTEMPDTLQTKNQTYTLRLPLETSEKSFVISDTLEVPMNKPPISQICKCTYRLGISEKKLVGNKGVFKGTASCKLLYISDDQTLCTYEQQLPFSQYCEFLQDYEEETVDIIPVVTGFDVETEEQEELRKVLLTIHILAQGCVSGNKTLPIIEDAYSTKGQLHPQWKTYTIDSLLDRRGDSVSVQSQFEGTLKEIIDADIYVGYPSVQQVQNSAQMTTPVCAQILGIDDNGELNCIYGKTDAVQKLALSQQATCTAQSEQVGPCYTSVLSGGIEVRCELLTDSRFYAVQDLRSLSGGSIEENEDREVHPSVVLKRAAKGTEIWDIAKTCRSRSDEIRSVNHLSDTSLPEDCILLIPVG